MKLPSRTWKWPGMLLVLWVFIFASGCSSSNSAGSPTFSPALAQSSCSMPFLLTMDLATVQKVTQSLGLKLTVRYSPSKAAPPGVVISQSPPSGTSLPGCTREVTVTISIAGTSSPAATASSLPDTNQPSKTAPAATPAATPAKQASVTPGGPTTALRGGPPPLTHLVYSDDFIPRQNGFKNGWTAEVLSGTSSISQDGFLEVKGEVTASLGDRSWSDYRITLRNMQIGYGLPALLVAFRYSDDANYAWLNCSEKLSDYWRLNCTWRVKAAGKELPVPNAEILNVCSAACTLEIEVKGDSYRLLSDGRQKSAINIAGPKSGQVVLGIKSPTKPFRLDGFEVFGFNPDGSGQTLFGDTFSDSFMARTRSSIANSEQVSLNGALNYQFTTANNYQVELWSEPRIPTLDRWCLAVEMTLPEGKQVAAGLMFRYLDASNHYNFYINSEGAFMIGGVFSGSPAELVKWTPSAAINPPGKPNLLQVIAQGVRYSFLVNGQVLLDQLKDTRLSNGTFGFLGVNRKNNDPTLVTFRDLELYDLP